MANDICENSLHSAFDSSSWVQELGLDCVAWAPAVYHDLLRSGDGTAEGIVAAYFGMVSQVGYTIQHLLSISTAKQDCVHLSSHQALAWGDIRPDHSDVCVYSKANYDCALHSKCSQACCVLAGGVANDAAQQG